MAGTAVASSPPCCLMRLKKEEDTGLCREAVQPCHGIVELGGLAPKASRLKLCLEVTGMNLLT